MSIVKAINSNPKSGKQTKKPKSVELDAQIRLAEILNDSPHLVSLNGTEWEVRALRMGTQWLIAQKVLEINKSEKGTYEDIIRQFAQSVPAMIDVLTLCLLNDKAKIFKDSDPTKGYSDLYKSTRNTLEWECDVTKFAEILFETLQMLDVSFFMDALGMLQIFRAAVTEKKRERTKIAEAR